MSVSRRLLMAKPAAGGGGSYSAEVLADSPLAYWRLEESSGTVVNDETGSHDGTSSNVTLGTAGQVGDAYTFNGSSSYFAVSSLWTLGSNLRGTTWEWWMKTTGTAGRHVFGTTNNGTSTNFLLAWNASTVQFDDFSTGSGRLGLYIRDAGGDDARFHTADVGINDGAWHHIVLTIASASPLTAGSVQFHVDGASVTTTHSFISSGIDSFKSFDHQMVFGARNNRGTIDNHFDGDLDEVAVYGSVLSAARILAHYNAA